MITHLEPVNLECEIKWALESITTNKASGGDGMPVELFQILKDDAIKMLHSLSQKIWKTHQWPQDWKRSVFIPKGNGKEHSNYLTTALISHVSKAMLNMPANLGNSAVATGLEKISFRSSSKEGQCKRTFKLLCHWTHFTC